MNRQSLHGLTCDRCHREFPLGSGQLAYDDDPEGLNRVLCKLCWAVLVLRPELRASA